MRQGEVWTVAGGGRVVITTEEEWNARTWPQAVIVARVAAGPLDHPFLVPVIDPDPVGGALLMYTNRPVNPADLLEHTGDLAGKTWATMRDAMRRMYDLPEEKQREF